MSAAAGVLRGLPFQFPADVECAQLLLLLLLVSTACCLGLMLLMLYSRLASELTCPHLAMYHKDAVHLHPHAQYSRIVVLMLMLCDYSSSVYASCKNKLEI